LVFFRGVALPEASLTFIPFPRLAIWFHAWFLGRWRFTDKEGAKVDAAELEFGVYLPYNYKLLNVFLNDRDERFNLIGPAGQ
jgi:hypothetical protein